MGAREAEIPTSLSRIKLRYSIRVGFYTTINMLKKLALLVLF
jgi:hypothetical protein